MTSFIGMDEWPHDETVFVNLRRRKSTSSCALSRRQSGQEVSSYGSLVRRKRPGTESKRPAADTRLPSTRATNIKQVDPSLVQRIDASRIPCFHVPLPWL